MQANRSAWPICISFHDHYDMFGEENRWINSLESEVVHKCVERNIYVIQFVSVVIQRWMLKITPCAHIVVSINEIAWYTSSNSYTIGGETLLNMCRLVIWHLQVLKTGAKALLPKGKINGDQNNILQTAESPACDWRQVKIYHLHGRAFNTSKNWFLHIARLSRPLVKIDF